MQKLYIQQWKQSSENSKTFIFVKKNPNQIKPSETEIKVKSEPAA